MKILVLGGTGAMGVELVKILVGGGINQVVVTSRAERKSNENNMKYVRGNAHDPAFLQTLLHERYDAIIDFMVYSTEEFQKRRDPLLNATDQYVFLSSSRVYADSEAPLTEDSPRLLDVTTDKAYLQTDEYALAKARQENLLRASGKTNWTILRPYITYSDQRLQLGVYEKELWLYRALHAQTVVMPTDVLNHVTTLTWGGDVARGIAALVGNTQAYGQAFHIATNEAIGWSEVLELYTRVFQEVTGRTMRVKLIDSSERMGLAIGSQYQIQYDRLFDRKFDNSKWMRITGEYKFTSPQEGLERCLRAFLNHPEFRVITMQAQAWMDKETGERTPLAQFSGYKNKMKYIIGRYTPYFAIKLAGKQHM